MRRTNIFSPSFDHSSERQGYRWHSARVGHAIGSKLMGARLYELADGENSHPYHFHHAIEEWLLVVAGSPVLRGADGERVLRPGDVACFPTGVEGAHQVRGPGTVLIVSASRSVEAIEYPDSGKIGVRPPGKVFRLADETDYWEGE
jgi:uncharacterized cupin superfamily protein